MAYEMISACESGNTDALYKLIKNKANLNIIYKNQTPLNVACSNGHYRIVKMLLDHSADPSDINNLYIAINHQYTAIVSELLKYNIDINKPLQNTTWTMLHYAIETQNLDIVKILLKNGAHVNTNTNIKPLHLACEKDNVNIVRELIQYNANVNDVSIENRWQPISYAVWHNKVENVRELIRSKSYIDFQKLYTIISISKKLDNKCYISIELELAMIDKKNLNFDAPEWIPSTMLTLPPPFIMPPPYIDDRYPTFF